MKATAIVVTSAFLMCVVLKADTFQFTISTNGTTGSGDPPPYYYDNVLYPNDGPGGLLDQYGLLFDVNGRPTVLYSRTWPTSQVSLE